MTKKVSYTKISLIVILGNILEYYDFLLFGHLGFIITPLFCPFYDQSQTHILSLFLFGLSFITRPIGGLIFGLVADKVSKKEALLKSVSWAVLPAIVFALLPTYETIGLLASVIFISLRLLQGIALGGEYPVAGSYLMDLRKNNMGFYSGILVGSVAIGSLAGLAFATVCLSKNAPEWLWRVAFLFGGLGVLLSYYLRKYLIDFKTIIQTNHKSSVAAKDLLYGRVIVFFISLVAGSVMWIPMIYSNFYITKILLLPKDQGIKAGLIALVFYIILCPIFGIIYDKVSAKRFILSTILLICPMSLLGINCLINGEILFAQFFLIISAASVGAPLHAIFNQIFPVKSRGKNIGFFYMIGLSFGGLLPSISSFIVDKTRFDYTPAVLLCLISLITAIILKIAYQNKIT